jgi:hypothetical protein
MNLNGSISNINPKAILGIAARYRNLVVILIIAGLLGYTGYQISRITSIQADPAYMAAQKGKDKVTSLKINKSILEQLQKLRPAGTSSAPVNVGKQDPFTL